MKSKRIFATPAVKIAATIILVSALAIFYKYAVSDYGNSIKKDLETLDTNILGVIEQQPKTLDDAMNALDGAKSSVIIDKTFLLYCHDNIDADIYDSVIAYLGENEYSDEMWKSICGYSALAIYDLSSGIADAEYTTVRETGNSLSLSFVGDISLDSNWNWSPMKVFAEKRSSLLEAAFSSELTERMLGTDMLFANLESPITSSGTRQNGVAYAHAAVAEDVEVLGMLGIDIVNIANDRIYDYSSSGFADTIAALENAGVIYTGGGENATDASAPRYLIAGGRKIAYVSALYTKTKYSAPEAAGQSAGIVYMTNSTHLTNSIAEAAENADYVIVYADFGDNTNTSKIDDTKISLAHSFIDAGADIILGCGISTIQPIEYYNDRPIIYSLGMFWYETDPHEALLVELSFESRALSGNDTADGYSPKYDCADEPSIKIIPCIQDGASVRIADVEARAAIIKKLAPEKAGATIDQNGYIIKS